MLNQKIKSIKSKNEELTLNIKSNLKKLEKQNQKLESLKNQNLELEQKIEIFEVENNLIKNEVTTQRLEMNQEKNKIFLNEGKMNEIEQKLKKLDSIHSIETRSSITSPQLIKTITPHQNSINSVNIFPSGNIISVSDDKSIKIYDHFFNLLQTIKMAHYCGILYVDIKDDNNFVTCSVDRSIKTWIKIENKFQIICYGKLNIILINLLFLVLGIIVLKFGDLKIIMNINVLILLNILEVFILFLL